MLRAEHRAHLMADTDDLVGKTLGDRWSLRCRLGAGGMGAVYLAHDLRGGPPAALKVVKRELSDDAEARARFAREAEALRLLDDPRIVRFFDTGETGDLRWIAMELLEGRTLKSRLQARGAFPWRESLPVIREVVLALDAAHRAGLIHRDLKPENIFLADGANGAAAAVKLLDFGVARHTHLPAGQTMTATGVVPGTPGFVAPEVVLKGPSNDPRSDYYGLGATWFEMLTGEKPFTAETPFALAMLHVTAEVPLPSSIRPSLRLPLRLEALLAALLAKTPEQRPASAEQILTDLDAIAKEPDGPLRDVEPISSLHNRFRPITNDATPHTRSLPGASDLQPHEATLTAGFTALEHAGRRPVARRRAALLGLAAVVALVVVLGAGYQLARGRHDRDTSLVPSEAHPAPPEAVPTPPVEPAPVVEAPAPTPSPTPPPVPVRPPKKTAPKGKPIILPMDQEVASDPPAPAPAPAPAQ